MKLSEFYFDLPKELIAQHPTEKRDDSRLLVLNKKNNTVEHKQFKDIISYLRKDDCLVINNTKVIPARLNTDGGGQKSEVRKEILLLKQLENDKWEVMVRPGKKFKVGAEVEFGEGILKGKILEVLPNGNRIIEFQYDGVFNEILDKIGLMPLPPYIKESLKEKDRYQTIYAKHEGSSAAPTAGLHFTEDILQEIKNKGIEIANVTLHIGIGTFRPVKSKNIEEHEMHSEHYIIKKEDAEKINNAKNNGNRVIAVGTTSCRVLETIADNNGRALIKRERVELVRRRK